MRRLVGSAPIGVVVAASHAEMRGQPGPSGSEPCHGDCCLFFVNVFVVRPFFWLLLCFILLFVLFVLVDSSVVRLLVFCLLKPACPCTRPCWL